MGEVNALLYQEREDSQITLKAVESVDAAMNRLPLDLIDPAHMAKWRKDLFVLTVKAVKLGREGSNASESITY